MAEGLENILCICPECKEKYSLSTYRKQITCTHCGHICHINNRYQIENSKFTNIAEWYDWQTSIFREEIENKDFCLESKVELRHLSTDGKSFTRPSGNGVCKLDKSGLTYIGTEDGKEITKFFPIESIYRLLFGAGEDFEIYDGKELYYFVPENKRSAVAWYIVSALLKD